MQFIAVWPIDKVMGKYTDEGIVDQAVTYIMSQPDGK
jgi:hypothetical protein